MLPPACPNEYRLRGNQVEPRAGYWNYCPQLRSVHVDELRTLTENKKSIYYFPPYPTDPAIVKKEFQELLDLAAARDNPCLLVNGSGYKDNDPKKLPMKFGFRLPISRLLNINPPPLGAVVVNRFPGEQIIRTGRGMARAVEAETPGLFHRHALNLLLPLTNWSPPRQALVWAALDVAISSALNAAWFYKWLALDVKEQPRDCTARRERPVEWDRRVNGKRTLNVLYDQPDELNPAFNLCPDARPGKNGKLVDTDSGTPRHPAYPSGHSTYAGAASEILRYFFGNMRTPPSIPFNEALGQNPNSTLDDELRNLADNIGLGRMWAGIHWRSDHEAGLRLGRAVARLVIQQLIDMGQVTKPQDSKCEEKMKIKVGAFDYCGPRRSIVDNCNPNDDTFKDEDGKKMQVCRNDAPPERDCLRFESAAIRNACPDTPKGDPTDCAPPVVMPEGNEMSKAYDGTRQAQ
jgi:hypothetical protein